MNKRLFKLLSLHVGPGASACCKNQPWLKLQALKLLQVPPKAVVATITELRVEDRLAIQLPRLTRQMYAIAMTWDASATPT